MFSFKINHKSKHEVSSYSYYDLLIPYVCPYFAYVLIASLLDGLSPLLNYSIRIIAVSILLLWFWRWYVPFTGPKSTPKSVLYGMIFGTVGTILWIITLKPFVDEGAKSWDNLEIFITTLKERKTK